MECRRGEGTGMECQRVDVKEQVWNVREVKEHGGGGYRGKYGGGGYRGKYRGLWVYG